MFRLEELKHHNTKTLDMPRRPYVLAETTWKTVRVTEYEVAVLPWGATPRWAWATGRDYTGGMHQDARGCPGLPGAWFAPRIGRVGLNDHFIVFYPSPGSKDPEVNLIGRQ